MDCSLRLTVIPSEALLNGQATQKLFVRLCLSFTSRLTLRHATPGLDYPYITSLLPNNTIEIHSIESQMIVQVIPAPTPSTSPTPSSPPGSAGHRRSGSTSSRGGDIDLRRLGLVSSIGGYMVPSTQRSEKMSKVPVKLIRTHGEPENVTAAN